jgi:hypothetical protein
MRQYITIIIPYVSPPFQTEWHPTERGGPFDPVSRGAFATEDEAMTWAQERLKGAPYSLRTVTNYDDL